MICPVNDKPAAAASASPPAAAGAGAPAQAAGRWTRFVGLDVHKKLVVACVLNAAGEKLHSESFDCTPQQLERFAKAWIGPEGVAALEATSNTWAVCNVLAPHCGAVKVSNPLKTKAIAQASVKTDKVDAQVLGQLLRCDYLPGVWTVDEKTRRLRQLAARRTALVQDRTAVKNRIHSTLAGELIDVPMARLYAPTGLDWLKKVAMDPQAREFIDSDLRILELLEKEIELLNKQLATQAYHDAQAKLLVTLPGVDYPVAMTLLAALGDVHRFADGDHAASYLGLTPSTRQSADHCYHGSITKQGNRHARWMLIEAAQHLDKNPGPLGVFFRRIAKKKNRNVAVVATARKMVTIAWLMLVRNEPYHYVQPSTTEVKLARLRIKAGGPKRVGGTPKGQPRSVNYGHGRKARTVAPLQEVYAKEALPEPMAIEQLPVGERAMLERTGTLGAVAAFRKPQPRVPAAAAEA